MSTSSTFDEADLLALIEDEGFVEDYYAQMYPDNMNLSRTVLTPLNPPTKRKGLRLGKEQQSRHCSDYRAGL
jgi:hypothetical protein